MKLKKGDKAIIIAGKDKGKEGVIERVYKKSEKVLIPGLNIYKKHVRKSQDMPQGGVVDLPRAFPVSNIMLVCPKCGKAARIGYKVENNKKIRICKKCESEI